MLFLPKSRLLLVLFVLVVAVGPVDFTCGQTIGGIERRNSGNAAPEIVVGGLVEMAETFVDRPHVYVNIPSELENIDYVKVANDDKTVSNYELDVTVSVNVTVYLFIDWRVGDDDNTDPPSLAGVMDWVAAQGFVDTGMTMDIDEFPVSSPGIDQHWAIYSRDVMAGTITVFEQDDSAERNMYGVAAKEANVPPGVDAGSDMQIRYPYQRTVKLAGQVEDDDPNGLGQLTMQWSLFDGPASVEFEDETDVNTVVWFDAVGEYQLVLRVWDEVPQEGNDVVVITVDESIRGDLDGNNKVNMLDLELFCEQWLDSSGCTAYPTGCADLADGNGVRLDDFSVFAGSFGMEYPSLESSLLIVELTENPYSYRVMEKDTWNVILDQSGTQFELPGGSYAAGSAYNIFSTATTMDADFELVGTSKIGHVKFTFEQPGLLKVIVSCNDDTPKNIKEEFVDKGEHYYGIWEYPQGGAIDNRGADEDLIGFACKSDTNFASGRAPFYVTSGRYGIYVDTVALGHYAIANGGATSFDFDEEQITYYVIYGPDYADILDVYNGLAGPAWMPPDWAFDSIWWRDDDYQDLGHWDVVEQRSIDSAEDNVMATANHLQYYQIPASTIWIDRPYTSGSWGWGNNDFNPASDWFPSGSPPGQGMIDYLENKGYHLLLWIANRCANNLYDEGMANGYLFNYSTNPAADVRRQEVYDWFKGKLNNFVDMGVRGYKIDRGHEHEMGATWDEHNAVENEVIATFAKLAAEGQMDAYGGDYLIHARNVFDESRKYVGVWNGDADCDFGGLQVSIKNGLRCGAMNFPYYGSDVGGYLSDSVSQELFARWLQFGAYSTMMEILIDPGRTIWYDSDYPHNNEPNLIDIARKQCADHHDIIAYTKTWMYYAHETGMPVMRQMIFEFPDDINLYDKWDEYFYGPEILVAPVVNSGATSRSVYLPTGKWLDYNDKDTVYTGASTITAPAPIEVIPLFVREGAIIPRGDILQSNNNWTPGWSACLRVEFFPQDNTSKSCPYYTGSGVVPVNCTMNGGGVISINFAALDHDGTLEIYCRQYSAVTKNGSPLTEGVDFTYDGQKNLITIPYTGAASIEITGATSIFTSP